MPPTSVDIRCPVGARRLFLRLQLEGESVPIVAGGLMQMACADCRKALVRQTGQEVARVFHYYDFAGRWIRTEVQHLAAD